MRTILFLSLLISNISNAYIPTGGYEGFKEPAANFASLPTVGNVLGDMRVTLSTFDTYVWDGFIWQLRSGSGGGGVSTVFGRGGSVTAQSGDYSSFYTLRSNDLSDISSPSSARTNLGLGNVDDTSDLNKPVSTATQTALDAKLPYNDYKVLNPNGNTGGYNYSDQQPQLKPLQNSPDESWNMWQRYVQVDPDSTGFSMGTNGTFGNIFNLGFNHQGTSDIGDTQIFNTYSSFGNGTDPFSLKGYQLMLGFGNINSGVTVTDSIQGYGFQLNVDAGATMDASSYITGFYDMMNVNTQVHGYQSMNLSPHLADVGNNTQATGINLNATVDQFTGKAGYTAIGIFGNYGSVGFGTGGINGININPTITNFGSGNYYNGIYSSTLGISGAGTNKWAGYFEGDVNITGNLSFGGALSIGKLSAYVAANTLDAGGFQPTTYHGLISQITSPNGVTTANFDYLGVNTASIYTAEANSHATSGVLGIGATSLGLPMVIKTETGSTTDNVTGALFAISMDGTSTGGTITQANGGRSVMIPNGITTINRAYGWFAEAPFGTIATDNWGIYTKDFEKNYFQGDLKVGGADTLSKSHYGIESEKTIASKNGLQAVTSGSQPTCDADHRGLMWNIEGGTGVADIFQICQKDATDTYVWVTH